MSPKFGGVRGLCQAGRSSLSDPAPLQSQTWRGPMGGCMPEFHQMSPMMDEDDMRDNYRPKQPPRDPLLQLVSLQKASGCWLLDPHLAAALGKTSEEVEKPNPASVKQDVWATILALIWLHGFKMDGQEEWELLSMKAVSWLRAQTASLVTECVEAGNALLGCNVQKDAVGL